MIAVLVPADNFAGRFRLQTDGDDVGAFVLFDILLETGGIDSTFVLFDFVVGTGGIDSAFILFDFVVGTGGIDGAFVLFDFVVGTGEIDGTFVLFVVGRGGIDGAFILFEVVVGTGGDVVDGVTVVDIFRLRTDEENGDFFFVVVDDRPIVDCGIEVVVVCLANRFGNLSSQGTKDGMVEFCLLLRRLRLIVCENMRMEWGEAMRIPPLFSIAEFHFPDYVRFLILRQLRLFHNKLDVHVRFFPNYFAKRRKRGDF